MQATFRNILQTKHLSFV